MGGLLDAQTPSAEVIAALTERADEFTWVAATVGAQQAAGLQLATEQPVMPIGGFNGSDPSPTLDAFIELVAEGRVHYFVGGGGFGPSQGGANTSSAIASWVQQHYESKTVGGVIMYDLTVEPT